jgi:hypothetical protein
MLVSHQQVMVVTCPVVATNAAVPIFLASLCDTLAQAILVSFLDSATFGSVVVLVTQDDHTALSLSGCAAVSVQLDPPPNADGTFSAEQAGINQLHFDTLGDWATPLFLVSCLRSTPWRLVRPPSSSPLPSFSRLLVTTPPGPAFGLMLCAIWKPIIDDATKEVIGMKANYIHNMRKEILDLKKQVKDSKGLDEGKVSRLISNIIALKEKSEWKTASKFDEKSQIENRKIEKVNNQTDAKYVYQQKMVEIALKGKEVTLAQGQQNIESKSQK